MFVVPASVTYEAYSLNGGPFQESPSFACGYRNGKNIVQARCIGGGIKIIEVEWCCDDKPYTNFTFDLIPEATPVNNVPCEITFTYEVIDSETPCSCGSCCNGIVYLYFTLTDAQIFNTAPPYVASICFYRLISGIPKGTCDLSSVPDTSVMWETLCWQKDYGSTPPTAADIAADYAAYIKSKDACIYTQYTDPQFNIYILPQCQKCCALANTGVFPLFTPPDPFKLTDKCCLPYAGVGVSPTIYSGDFASTYIDVLPYGGTPDCQTGFSPAFPQN